ncbi:peptidase S41 [Butyricicoccus sp. 1XD8-22]|nr:peptidase S41 [Butyricicoccus sp. 1XD8-22]
MWKRGLAGGLCGLLLSGLGGCAQIISAAPGEPAASSPDEGSGQNEYAPYAALWGLTAEQRQEDFAYFEQQLRENYPCWGILERNGTDYEAILDEYREMAAQTDNDFELYVAVNSALYRLGGQGHLSMIDPEWFGGFRDAYNEHAENGHAEGETRERWQEVLNDPVTVENYGKLLTAVKALSDGEDGGSGPGEPEASADSVTTLIIEEGKIAYLKIDSFDTYDADKEKVSAFLDKVHGYSHLIIDITQNSGGSDSYWMDLLVAPLAKTRLSSTSYALVRSAENTAPYLEEAFGADELRPVSELPQLPALEPRDRELATHFIENTLEVEPLGSGFDGEIWLLVSEYVYSASEAFTVFCKDTGFATVVGMPTGGDGIGIDPVFLRLPNSGLLVRYAPLFGLNPDGSSNEEYGSAPDLLSPDGESPLITALRAIREG